jgi:hypothetical protein
MTVSLPSDASGSERVGGFLGGLHPITRFLVAIAVLHLVATIYTVAAGLMEPLLSSHPGPLGSRLAEHARSIAYSLGFFGSAASVEFLFRIWSELKLARIEG